MDNKTAIKELLHKPLWQMTGAEFVTLYTYACTINSDSTVEKPAITQINGVGPLADYCVCSVSQIAKLLREGVLDSAILSRIGKSIVFDGEEARRCANEYQDKQRALRRGKKKE